MLCGSILESSNFILGCELMFAENRLYVRVIKYLTNRYKNSKMIFFLFFFLSEKADGESK